MKYISNTKELSLVIEEDLPDVGDLMHNQADTRHNAVKPFKRVWKSAGLNVKGSKTVLINHTNRETW